MEPTPVRQEVTVTDVNMPFGSMVRFMVKWAFAAIPALIILFLVGLACSFAFTLIVLSWKPLLTGRQSPNTKSIEARANEYREQARKADLERRTREIRERLENKDEPTVDPPPLSVDPAGPPAALKTKTKHIVRTEYVIASSVTRLYHRKGCPDIQPQYTRVSEFTARSQGIYPHSACANFPKDVEVSESWY